MATDSGRQTANRRTAEAEQTMSVDDFAYVYNKQLYS